MAERSRHLGDARRCINAYWAAVVAPVPMAELEKPGWDQPGPVEMQNVSRVEWRSTLIPPEFGMRFAPLCMALPVLADHDVEANAGLAVASVAELMEADHLGLPRILGADKYA